MELTRREWVAGAGAAVVGGPALARAGAAEPATRMLANPAASARTRALYRFLWTSYGRKTLSGQQECPSRPEAPRGELEYIQKTCGKLPAILGLDYIDPEDTAVNDRAARWYLEEGGIVTLCWHWGVPTIGTGYENSTKEFDIAAALKPDTPEGKAMRRDLAWCADRLTELRDRGVPVLWRPFHEFSGDWFWWGKRGPEAFKALWALMHDYFTRVRKLDNLIWVLGWAGQNVDPAYYPGRATVDVAGADIYAHDHGNLASMFAQVKAIVGDTLPICLHENGPIPDPAGLGPDADWLWFMTWHTRWITGADQNTPEDIRRAYLSDRVLTKDELPKLV